MIAFLLFVIGLCFHLGALFLAFGCGVEAERIHVKKMDVNDKPIIGVYAIFTFVLALLGVILIMASTRVT